MTSTLINTYFREENLPHIWCPGCGHGIITRAITKAIDNLGYNKEEICIVSGIGCSSRASSYLNFDTLHTTHGRALAFATGVKFSKPNLKVIVITGDGDCTAIGGNHFIHACRRNIDLTTIVYNNNIYGMTGGQFSPTTPTGEKGTTVPYGNIDRNFDICELAIASGASYVGRGTAYHANMLINLIENGMRNKGFSVIEALSVCPTYYGRKNKKGSAIEMLKEQKERCITSKMARKYGIDELQNKILIGELRKCNYPEYTEEYEKLINIAKERC